VTFVTDKVDGVQHGDGSSTVSTAGGVQLQGSMVLDATGHSRRLVQFDQKFDPGYQGAYGITAGEGRGQQAAHRLCSAVHR
jgi:lycopene beta-cyclase